MRPLLVLLSLVVACGADASPPTGIDRGDGGAAVDSAFGGDASVADSGPSSEDFPGFAADPESDVGAAPGRGDDRDACYQASCDAAECGSVASCCIDRADCCVATEIELPATLPFDCELDDCLATVAHVRFGSPEPFAVESIGLAAGGDGQYDSGLLLGGPLGLESRRVRLTARWDRTPCEGCVVSFAVGLTAQPTFDTRTHVDPLIAMQVSASRDGVALIVGDREVARHAPFDADARWTLEARPDGVAHLLRDDAIVASARYAPASARVVLFGHSLNPGASADPSEPRVLLRELEASAALCDAASAWGDRELVRVFEGATERVFDEVDDVAVARVGGATWLAFTAVENDLRSLHVARESAGLALLPDAAYPESLRPSSAPESSTLASPTLAADAAGDLHLVVARDGALESYRWQGEQFVPSDLGLHELPFGLAEPSLVFHLGHAVLVARTGEGLAVFLRGPDTGGVWLAMPSALGALAEARQPTLVVHQRAYQLHYAWRSGTRWQLGLAASDELIAWRSVSPDVLESAVGFDARGPRAAGALSDGDDLALYYVADDGVRRRLARTRRPAPPDARIGGGS